MDRTLAIVKPDAVESRKLGRILAHIEEQGFTVVALRMVRLTRRQAEAFYAIHRDRPFFNDLTTFMSSGPCVVMTLEAPQAVDRWRKLMGATDPAKADEQTLRRQFGTSIERNAVHGSDSFETAVVEIGYFFGGIELL